MDPPFGGLTALEGYRLDGVGLATGLEGQLYPRAQAPPRFCGHYNYHRCVGTYLHVVLNTPFGGLTLLLLGLPRRPKWAGDGAGRPIFGAARGGRGRAAAHILKNGVVGEA